ncbi:hypothetical protein BAU15_03005 [Enterococcus sp. JM4C]|uniref:DUF3784 domain-containing protein n=1 Tax=Candidatus Enterococcus huntleyi TaxID=1857217 RepID=UPI00137ADDB1|nr:DUF3784 domain-containing protein [Enterococcus sp. JM4C]KAF1299625.1 hypothetical protein BAU15_03005 [Enterococcus sp. JM4C]
MIHSDTALALPLAAILILMGVQLLRGKWLMLMAGYNTMTKEERAKVNGKNLGKLIGSLLLWVALMLILRVSIVPYDLPLVIGTLLPLAPVLILANTSKYFKA